MKHLTPPDSHHLNAAVGWLGLGNWKEANEELEKIKPNLRAHPVVLQVRCQIYFNAGKWDAAAEIAKALTKMTPDDPGAWISLAYTTRRKDGGGIPAAKEILIKAHETFPKEPIIAYNLACYECQSGHLAEAKAWLNKSYEFGDAKQIKSMALDDPDLGPLFQDEQA